MADYDLTEQAIANKTFDADSQTVGVSVGFRIPTHDYVERTLTNSTTETYVYKTGGSTGEAVATVVIVYTDSTLETIASATKT